TLATGAEVRVLYDVLLALRGQTLVALVPGSEQRERAELMFHEAASTVSEALERVQAHRRIRLKIRARSVAGIVTGFNAWRSIDEIERRLIGDLTTLGVGTCYVATYEPGSERSRAKLVFAYDANRKRAVTETGSFPSEQLVPASLARDDHWAGLVVA